MKFSVIVPVYNVEKYLDRCVNSILSQTYTDFELILVDDGSPDNCPKMCDDWAKKDSRIVVIHKENGGLSSTRNAGLDIATGKYVYFIDSDDYIEPNLLETCVNYMEQGYDLFCFMYKYVWDNGKEKPAEVRPAYFSENNFTSIQDKLQCLIDFANYCMPHEVCFKMFKMDIIQKYNIRFEDTQKVLSEDMCFCLYYLTFCNKIFSSNKVLYNYLQREDSLYAQTKKDLPLNKINELLKCYYNFLKINNCKQLLKNFTCVYFNVLQNFISVVLYQKKLQQINIVQKRDFLKQTIQDWDFYCKNLKHLKKYKKKILSLRQNKYTTTGEFDLSSHENSFLINGNMFLYKLKRVLYNKLKPKILKNKKLYLLNELSKFSKHKNKIYFLGTEACDNVGDLYINETIIEFLNKNFPNYFVFEVEGENYKNYKNILQKFIKKQDIIILPGGGNFGNEYIVSDNTRMDVIATWKENKKIIFPQTIFFTKDEKGEQSIDYSKQIYTKENNVICFTREKFSYDFAKQNYTCFVSLTPDILLYNIIKKDTIRDSITLCFRSDRDSVLNNKAKDAMFSIFKQFSYKIKCFDMITSCCYDFLTRDLVVDDVLDVYCQSKLVITDRLHGMIVSAITGTPCVAISNYNHKIKGSYEWVKHLPYIKFIEDVNDMELIEKAIKELLEIKETKYDNSVLMPYYEKIVQKIKG